jgi:hypothetical protein
MDRRTDGRTEGRTDDTTISVEPIFFKCALKILGRNLNFFMVMELKILMKSFVDSTTRILKIQKSV